jgi:hypothetical protein
MMLDNFISWLYTKTIWGPRCPDYDPDCVCCRQWGIHDDLFENKIMNETPKSLQHDTETIAEDKMGWRYEVNIWDGPVDGQYNWLQIYAGGSIIMAVYNMWWAKRHSWKCIKLEYRP